MSTITDTKRAVWQSAKEYAAAAERAFQAAEAECDRLHRARMEAHERANALFNEYIDATTTAEAADPVGLACSIKP